MDDALERADAVIVEGRDRVRNLRPPKQSRDLAEALAEAAKQVAWDERARFRLVAEGKPRPLHPIVFAELIEIGREAIGNALRHAEAGTVEASVIYGRRELRLRVRDDGVGIDPQICAEQGRDGHFGLAGMRERARKIRGELTLLSRPGVGTDVVVEVPAKIAYARSASAVYRFHETAEE